MMEIETLIYSLILAGISGLTFVAYKHPIGYQKIFVVIITPVLLVPTMFISAHFGSIYGRIRALKEDLDERPERLYIGLYIGTG